MSVAKRLVSKNKKRYKEDGFDLDLSYITPNMIAMGFPAEKIEGVFRNHIDDVYKFFKLKHDGHFLIYNLCSERQSNEGKLENRVVRFPFDDHNPPPFPLIYNFCIHAKSYLDEDEKNIIGVHCKAGKGRTGVMICCLLMFLDVKLDPDTAMNYYAKMRTYDEKGVTIPSQQRYIHYFYLYLKNFKTQTECNIKEYTPQKLHIDTLLFDGIGGKNDMLEIKIKAYSEHTCIYKTSWLTPNTLRNSTISQARIAPFVISGDIMFEVFVKNKHHRIMGSMIGKFWLNTYFMTKEYDAQLNQRELPNENTCISANNLNDLFNLTEDDYLWIMLHKQDIDKLNKDLLDKEVPKNFKIIFGISKHPLYCHKIVSDISIPLSKHSKKQKKKQRSLFSNIVSLFDKSHATERRLAHSTIFKRNNRLPSKDISKSTKNLDKKF